jgi:hypothetical protein
MVAINIHDRLSSEATGLCFVLVACHIKGYRMSLEKKSIVLKQITELK